MRHERWTEAVIIAVIAIGVVSIAHKVYVSVTCAEWRTVPGVLVCSGGEHYQRCEPERECVRRK